MSDTAHVAAEIRWLLYRHYRFEECLLKSVDWVLEGFALDFRFDYFWSDYEGLKLVRGVPEVRAGAMRTNLDTPKIVTLRLVGIQEYHLHNWMSGSDLDNLETEPPGWGSSEVAVVDLERKSPMLAPYRHLDKDLHHLACRWERDRRIDVVFHSARVIHD